MKYEIRNILIFRSAMIPKVGEISGADGEDGVVIDIHKVKLPGTKLDELN
jgi:hypothetical protein